MSEKRFTFSTKWRWILFDNETEKFMDMEDCKDKLNEQQAEIERLEKIIALTNYQLKVQDRTINELEKNIQDLEGMLDKIPKSIKELWIE